MTMHSLSRDNISNLSCFIDILINVQERLSVSTPNPSSIDLSSQCKTRGLIDKLCFRLVTQIERDKLVEHVKSLGVSIKGVKLKDKKWYLEIGDAIFWIYLGHRDNNLLQRVILNPSKFKTYNDMELTLLRFFKDRKNLFNSEITRVDLTIDYYEPYKEIVRGLDIKHKSRRIEYLESSGRRTGIMVGNGDEKIVIYNKRIESKLDYDVTRIEKQLSGRKLPIKYFNEFKKLETIVQKVSFFDDISISELTIFKDGLSYSKDQTEKCLKFEALIDANGFFLTRKKLNENRNFKRNYGRFFKLATKSKQPNEILRQGMKDYFNSNVLSLH